MLACRHCTLPQLPRCEPPCAPCLVYHPNYTFSSPTSSPICDLLSLRITCAYLRDLIPRPSHTQLLLAESTPWAAARDLYTCRYCLRLRTAGTSQTACSGGGGAVLAATQITGSASSVG
ncbi:hypothetical protein N7470_007068 [Penicillium chermesinum]|nr:hypothetical protein N7470_007068 [Penicillium chermesinum]